MIVIEIHIFGNIFENLLSFASNEVFIIVRVYSSFIFKEVAIIKVKSFI